MNKLFKFGKLAMVSSPQAISELVAAYGEGPTSKLRLVLLSNADFVEVPQGLVSDFRFLRPPTDILYRMQDEGEMLEYINYLKSIGVERYIDILAIATLSGNATILWVDEVDKDMHWVNYLLGMLKVQYGFFIKDGDGIVTVFNYNPAYNNANLNRAYMNGYIKAHSYIRNFEITDPKSLYNEVFVNIFSEVLYSFYHDMGKVFQYTNPEDIIRQFIILNKSMNGEGLFVKL